MTNNNEEERIIIYRYVKSVIYSVIRLSLLLIAVFGSAFYYFITHFKLSLFLGIFFIILYVSEILHIKNLDKEMINYARTTGEPKS